MMFMAYVCGPYSAKTIEKRNQNIAEADAVGRELLAKGYAPFVPHNNTADWEHDLRFKHEDFVEADLSILPYCSIVVLFGDWRSSKGAQQEITCARDNGIPIYGDVKCVPDACEIMPDVTTKVIRDLLERRKLGVKNYGVPLTAFNGKDAAKDTYEEVLDALVYVTQKIVELDADSIKSLDSIWF